MKYIKLKDKMEIKLVMNQLTREKKEEIKKRVKSYQDQ
jgi:hypothetical protein